MLKSIEEALKRATDEEFSLAAVETLARTEHADDSVGSLTPWDELTEVERDMYRRNVTPLVRALMDADLLPSLKHSENKRCSLDVATLRDLWLDPSSHSLTDKQMSEVFGEILESRATNSYTTSGYRYFVRKLREYQDDLAASEDARLRAMNTLDRFRARVVVMARNIRDRARENAHERDAARIEELEQQLTEWQEIAQDRLDLAQVRKKRIRELEEQVTGQRAVVDVAMERGLREILDGDE